MPLFPRTTFSCPRERGRVRVEGYIQERLVQLTFPTSESALESALDCALSSAAVADGIPLSCCCTGLGVGSDPSVLDPHPMTFCLPVVRPEHTTSRHVLSSVRAAAPGSASCR